MSRLQIPSASIRVGGLGRGIVQVPRGGGEIAAGIAAAGQGFAQTLLGMDARRLEAHRARTITDFDSRTLNAISVAEDEARKADPSQSVQVFNENDAIVDLADEVNAFQDPVVRSETNRILTRATDVAGIRVRRNADYMEVQADIASVENLKKQTSPLVRSGQMTAEEATAKIVETLSRYIGTAYTEETARANAAAFEARAVREEFDFMLQGGGDIPPNPARALDYLTEPLAQRVLPAGERRDLTSIAQRKLDEVESERFIAAVSVAKETIDGKLTQTATDPGEFQSLVNQAVAGISALPGADDLRREIALTDDQITIEILQDALEVTARRADIDRFNIVADAMPDSAESQIIVEKNKDLLRSSLGQANAAALISVQVDEAVLHGTRLAKSPRMRKAVDADAQRYVNGIYAAGATPTGDELLKDLVDRYGPTTLLPSEITKNATAVIQQPNLASPAQISESIDVLTYAQAKFPRAYEQSVDSDIQKWHRMVQSLVLPGMDMRELANLVHEEMNPSNPARADQIAAQSETLTNFALSEFVRFAADDDLINLDLEADFTITRLFGMEEERPRLRTDIFGDELPADVIGKYINWTMLNMKMGMSGKAATNDAWQRLKDSGMATTRVFQDERRIRMLTPERVYGSETYEWRDMETDLADVIGVDAREPGRLIWPEAMADEGNEFPTVNLASEMVVGDPFGPDFRDRVNNIGEIRKYARERLDLIPISDARGGYALQTGGGDRLPLYWLHYVDDEGRRHPVYQTDTNPEGEEITSAYMIAPIETAGITFHLNEANTQYRNVQTDKRIKAWEKIGTSLEPRPFIPPVGSVGGEKPKPSKPTRQP